MNDDLCIHGKYFCAVCATGIASSQNVFETVMSSLSVEKKSIKLPGPRVLGFRAFRMGDDDILYGMAHGSWNVKGDLPVAECVAHDRHPIGEPIPSLNCSCGWHAYKDLDSLRADKHDARLNRPGVDVFVGAVIGWGRIAPHVNGWRSERVRLVALMTAAQNGGETLAEKFGIPLFRFSYPVGGEMNGFELGAIVKTYRGPGVIVGASTLRSVNYVRVATDGHVQRYRDTDLRQVELMPDITDGATRMYHGRSFEEAYAKTSSAMATFATQFGTPLDEIESRYNLTASPTKVVEYQTGGVVPAPAIIVSLKATTTALKSFAAASKQLAAYAAMMPVSKPVATTRKKLYDRKWRDAKRAGAAAFARFKSDWAAGLVTDAWRP
jgi:hypothetical protein